MRLHEDPVARERIIRDYLLRRMDQAAIEDFERHYMDCEECFDEIQGTRLLLSGLSQPSVEQRRREDVVVLAFRNSVQLTRQAAELRELLEGVLGQRDRRVLIDLSRVSRIDSAGLGTLVNCYSHAVRNQGVLKLLRPSEPVRRLLKLTRIDAVIESFDDEAQAVQSFRSA